MSVTPANTPTAVELSSWLVLKAYSVNRPTAVEINCTSTSVARVSNDVIRFSALGHGVKPSAAPSVALRRNSASLKASVVAPMSVKIIIGSD